MYDVLIIGCGVIGSAMAYTLSRYQLKVCVCERFNDVANGVTKANSAILHAGFDCPPGSLEARMNLEGIAMAREICKKLDVEYRDIPSFVIAFDEREMEYVRGSMTAAWPMAYRACVLLTGRRRSGWSLASIPS